MEDKEIYNQVVVNDKKLKVKQYEEDYKIYELLKNGSKTYGELEEKIIQIGRDIIFLDTSNDIGKRLLGIYYKEIKKLQIEKRKAELEGSVQVQPMSVKVRFTNLNELEDIISEINHSTQRLKQFKLETKSE